MFMENEMNIKKYYLVFLENISKERVGNLKDVVYSLAEEHRGVLTDLLTDKVIFCSSSFDTRQFKESNATLYGFKKMETTREQTLQALRFLSTESVRQHCADISLLEKLTVDEAQKRYSSLLETERNFASFFGVDLEKVQKPQVMTYEEYLENDQKKGK